MAEISANSSSRLSSQSEDAMFDGARYLSSLRDSREVYFQKGCWTSFRKEWGTAHLLNYCLMGMTS